MHHLLKIKYRHTSGFYDDKSNRNYYFLLRCALINFIHDCFTFNNIGEIYTNPFIVLIT